MEQDSSQIRFPEFQCKANNPAPVICINKQCQYPGLMCYSEDCLCMKRHPQCHTFLIKKITDKIKKSIKRIPQQTKKSFELLEKQILNIIKQLSLVRQDIILSQQCFGLAQAQKKFYYYIVNTESEKLNGKLIDKIQQQFKQKKQEDSIIISSQYIQRVIYQQKQKINKICQKFKFCLKEGFDSKITVQLQLLKEWIQLSLNKPIQKFKILYRASQNNFEASQFHNKCDNKKNTLVLIKTQFDRIIGGFTNLQWNHKEGSYTSDGNYQTFVFSLTTKQKMLNQKINQKDLRGYSAYGPTFGGGHDIYICDKANITNNSYCNFPYTYNNGKYMPNQQSYTAMCGQTKGYNFLVKQYQVFEVITNQDI